jgi:Helicase HerA, central domain
MQLLEPCIYARFPIHSLVSRRSFVFARAGFGKSNLTKLLFSTLYRDKPSVPKRGGRRVPVGTVIFDPDGEYFWPDHAGRPGLCDVPELEDKVVVFTSRQGPSPFYTTPGTAARSTGPPHHEPPRVAATQGEAGED